MCGMGENVHERSGQGLKKELTGGVHLSLRRRKRKKENEREGGVRWAAGLVQFQGGPVGCQLFFCSDLFFFSFSIFLI
jgi:hypothetical protein